MDAGLYIVGTPIGNLGDITLRALDTLREADLILAEDTRHTRKLCVRHDVHTPLLSCHRFNEASRVEEVLRRIREGAAVALVSNAGMPAVSDPGRRVVRACREANLPVTAAPGPSAVTTAFALSGLGDEGFVFTGFLPHKSGARRRRLDELSEEGRPVIFFESPHRLLRLLGEIEEAWGDRRLFVARELTKQFEETCGGTPAELRAHFEGRRIRGELVVVAEGASRRRPTKKRGKQADD